MIEKKLYDIILTRVSAVGSGSQLFGLFVHDHLWRAIDISTKPNGIRVGRPEPGLKGPGVNADRIIEGECAIPVLVYVWIDDAQDGGAKRATAFQKADDIANELLLFLWNNGLDSQQLIFADAEVPFARIDHNYDSNHYAVVSMTLTLSEVVC